MLNPHFPFPVNYGSRAHITLRMYERAPVIRIFAFASHAPLHCHFEKRAESNNTHQTPKKKEQMKN